MFAFNRIELRATDFSKISDKLLLDRLPTNNLVCERGLSVFDRKAKIASGSRNRNFKVSTSVNSILFYVDQYRLVNTF